MGTGGIGFTIGTSKTTHDLREQGITRTGSDITVAGSQIWAGQDVRLDAARDVHLLAAQDTQQTTGKNSSSGGGVGVSVGGGTSGYGISVFANVNAAKGHEKGNGTAWTETTLDSGGTLSLSSGRDAILDGAQVSGDAIVADIGRDLLMRSQHQPIFSKTFSPYTKISVVTLKTKKRAIVNYDNN